MKKLLTIALGCFQFACLQAQNVGVNTNTPATTLQVVGQPAQPALADGITFPSLTGDQLKAKDDVYRTDHVGTIVHVTAAASPTTAKTIHVDAPGLYYFDGSVWVRTASATYASGQLLNSVFFDDGRTSSLNTSSGSWTDVLSYTYTPKHNDSRILVQYHNNNYLISGNSAAQRDEFQSRILVGAVSTTTNIQTMSTETGASSTSQFRTGTLFPIVSSTPNTVVTPVTIRVQVHRSSGDDNITINHRHATLIIQEIAN